MNSPSEKVTLDTNDVVLCLIDHQSGLLNLVKDMPVHQLRNNIVALAKVATMLRIPIVTTASVPEGQNGPLIPEIKNSHHKQGISSAMVRLMPGMFLSLSEPWKRQEKEQSL